MQPREGPPLSHVVAAASLWPGRLKAKSTVVECEIGCIVWPGLRALSTGSRFSNLPDGSRLGSLGRFRDRSLEGGIRFRRFSLVGQGN